jgi:hypothetical protein
MIFCFAKSLSRILVLKMDGKTLENESSAIKITTQK